MKRKDVIAKMLQEDQEEHIAVSVWCADDVLKQADEDGFEINEAEANWLIDEIHDGCQGGTIDWSVLSESIRAHMESLEPDCFTCHNGIVYTPARDSDNKTRPDIVICRGCLVENFAPHDCEIYLKRLDREQG